jgi:hypothetical protein
MIYSSYISLPYYERTVATSLFGPALHVHDLQCTAHKCTLAYRIYVEVELTSAAWTKNKWFEFRPTWIRPKAIMLDVPYEAQAESRIATV